MSIPKTRHYNEVGSVAYVNAARQDKDESVSGVVLQCPLVTSHVTCQRNDGMNSVAATCEGNDGWF